jgi:hypothetical protein
MVDPRNGKIISELEVAGNSATRAESPGCNFIGLDACAASGLPAAGAGGFLEDGVIQNGITNRNLSRIGSLARSSSTLALAIPANVAESSTVARRIR